MHLGDPITAAVTAASSLLGPIQKLLGWGDPNAYEDVAAAVISLRQQVADATNALAGSKVDNFALPFGGGIGEADAYAKQIAGSLLGTSEKNVKRGEFYKAIEILQAKLASLQAEYDRREKQSLLTALTSNSSSNSTMSYVPWIAAAGLLILAMKG